MASIIKRIDVLSELNLINDEDRLDLMALIEIIETHLKIEVTEENGGILITHISAMFQRNKNGEQLDSLAKEIILELEDNENYDAAIKVAEKIAAVIKNDVSVAEKGYLLLHLCTLISNTNREV